MLFSMNESTELTIQYIEKYLEAFRSIYLPSLLKNEAYYLGKNPTIMNRTFEDSSKPNNKIASGWGKYIITQISGYFGGKPVVVDSTDQSLLQEIEYFDRNNDTISKNMTLSKYVSEFGYCAEILYMDDDKNIYTLPQKPTSIFPIYSESSPDKLLYAIRFYDTYDVLTGNVITYVDVYTETNIKHYKTSNTTNLAFIDEITHYFKEVPVIFYYNNDDLTSDTQAVHSEIDCYDLALSDDTNFREEINDSYLIFTNTNLDNEDIMTMKKAKVIQIESSMDGQQASVNFLNRDANDTQAENFKSRLENDIKTFSFVKDIESAKSHTTATSAQIGLLGIEQICTIKEAYFRKALLKRYELLINYLAITKTQYDINTVSLTFVRNLPQDLTVIGDIVSKMNGVVSKKTLLKQIPFVSDIDEELSQIESENNINSYASLFDMGSDNND